MDNTEILKWNQRSKSQKHHHHLTVEENYEIYRQKYEKKRDTSHVRHKKNFLSAAKNEAERKEMLEKEINGIDNSM